MWLHRELKLWVALVKHEQWQYAAVDLHLIVYHVRQHLYYILVSVLLQIRGIVTAWQPQLPRILYFYNNKITTNKFNIIYLINGGVLSPITNILEN